MVMNETDLIERDLKRDIWQETLDAVRAIKSGKVLNMQTHELKVIFNSDQKVENSKK